MIIALHGIRTPLLKKGWMREFEEVVGNRAIVEPIPYGFLPVVLFLVPWIRKRRVKWFQDQWSRLERKHGVTPSVVAHSFGTYLIAETLRKYPQVKLDRIVFCGSIVQKHFPWRPIYAGKQLRQLLNQHGGVDFWAGIVQWVVQDAGDSGRSGFVCPADLNTVLKQESYPVWGHGDYFYRENYERWLTFLKGEELSDYEPVPAPGRNLRPLLMMLVLVSLIGLGIWYYGVDGIPDPVPPTPTPTPTLTVTPTPTPRPFTVNARDNHWVYSEVALSDQQMAKVTVDPNQSSWSVEGGHQVSCFGGSSERDTGSLAPGLERGALIVKIGDDKPVEFSSGDHEKWIDSPGKIQFACNDLIKWTDAYGDNSGSVRVFIDVMPKFASATPSPTPSTPSTPSPTASPKKRSLAVLGVRHQDGTKGKYFGFEAEDLDSILGPSNWRGKGEKGTPIYISPNENGRFKAAIVWDYSNGTDGSARGRYKDGKEGDWHEGDSVYVRPDSR